MSRSFTNLPFDSQNFLSKSPIPADKSFGFLTEAQVAHFGDQKLTTDCFSLSQKPKAAHRNESFQLNKGMIAYQNVPNHINQCFKVLLMFLFAILSPFFRQLRSSRTRVMSLNIFRASTLAQYQTCDFIFLQMVKIRNRNYKDILIWTGF